MDKLKYGEIMVFDRSDPYDVVGIAFDGPNKEKREITLLDHMRECFLIRTDIALATMESGRQLCAYPTRSGEPLYDGGLIDHTTSSQRELLRRINHRILEHVAYGHVMEYLEHIF